MGELEGGTSLPTLCSLMSQGGREDLIRNEVNAVSFLKCLLKERGLLFYLHFFIRQNPLRCWPTVSHGSQHEHNTVCTSILNRHQRAAAWKEMLSVRKMHTLG